MVGSSRTYNAPTRPEPSCEANLILCASPPDNVCARRSSDKYSMPTLSIKSRRDSISRKTTLEIFFSRTVNLRFSKKSYASLMDIDVKSTMFLLPIKTCSASSRSLAPLQTGQTSLPKKCRVPRPLHSGQAPYGELKENSLGSTSGYEYPSRGHDNFEDIKNSSGL